MQLAAYIRTSTDEQELGLEAQTAKIRAYCELYGHELVGVFSDQASGRSMSGRPALAEALSAKCEGVIVAKLDRLTRSVGDLGLIIEKLGSRALVSVGEQVDTSSAAGRLVLHILTSVAQWEREAISERTSAALQAKRSRGERAGAVPFGYTADESGRLHTCDREQTVIARVRDLRSRGNSINSIVLRLEKEGAKGRTGSPLRATQVQRILKANA
jgi:DNA invertase Pin-like site-specific DNA recombinase